MSLITVTGIRQTSPERFVLEFSDGSELKTTLSVLTDRFIHTGTELDDEAYSALHSASTLSLCKARALRIINARPMSQQEMRKRLIEKGEVEENAEAATLWLCDMGLIDDRRYAASLVRHYAAKGFGRARITQELRRHGIGHELWDEALCEMPEQDDRLRSFIASRLTDPDDKVQVRKISNTLFRRGYSWDEIRHAINQYISEEFQ